MNSHLLSIKLTLRWDESASKNQPTRELPRWWGRATHALVYHLLQQAKPELAEELHEHDSAPRPFTASTLMGNFPQGLLDANTDYSFRLTSLNEEISDILYQHTPKTTLNLDYIPFTVQACDITSAITYQELASANIFPQENPSRQLGFRFLSPTAFKSAGRHVPLPTADLIFGSLLDKWNLFSPLSFPAEVRRYAAECLAINRYKLETRVIPLKGQSRRIGALGEIFFTSLNYDRYWLSLLHTLANFSTYAGIGIGTTMGLGQCIPLNRPLYPADTLQKSNPHVHNALLSSPKRDY